ncbi:hypothetical protein UC317_1410 [Lactococcus lactis subsp. lactis]|nr:hypothetical protein UC317_1410 [Lactococcus lactis subsp. lactis]
MGSARLVFASAKIDTSCQKTPFFVPITKKSVQKMGDNSLKNLSIFFVQ